MISRNAFPEVIIYYFRIISILGAVLTKHGRYGFPAPSSRGGREEGPNFRRVAAPGEAKGVSGRQSVAGVREEGVYGGGDALTAGGRTF